MRIEYTELYCLVTLKVVIHLLISSFRIPTDIDSPDFSTITIASWINSIGGADHLSFGVGNSYGYSPGDGNELCAYYIKSFGSIDFNGYPGIGDSYGPTNMLPAILWLRSPHTADTDYAYRVNPSGIVSYDNYVYYNSYGSPGSFASSFSWFIASFGLVGIDGEDVKGSYGISLRILEFQEFIWFLIVEIFLIMIIILKIPTELYSLSVDWFLWRRCVPRSFLW